jgi:regulator of replication initiation timing
MKKVIALVVLSFVVFSCSKAKETAEKASVVSQVVEIVENDSLTMIEKVEQALSKASDLDKKIKKKVVDVNVLTKEKKELVSENKTLKVELNTAKDSLASVTEQLVKSKVKVAKKQGFFGKLIGKKPDSIEVEKVDTIKSK